MFYGLNNEVIYYSYDNSYDSYYSGYKYVIGDKENFENLDFYNRARLITLNDDCPANEGKWEIWNGGYKPSEMELVPYPSN